MVNTITVSAAEVMSPAKPITSTQLYIYEITSEKVGQEIIYGNNGINMDHGGTWFQAITAEVGYAKSRFAYFNGMRMTLTATEPIFLDSDNIIGG